jgi:hypothetical protein
LISSLLWHVPEPPQGRPNPDAAGHQRGACALRKARNSSLAIIIDNKLFDNVVMTRRRGLRPEAYQRVVIPGKNGTSHVAWVTIPGSGLRKASVTPALTGPALAGAEPIRAERLETGHEAGRERMRTSVKAALIGAGGVVAAAVITSAATSFGSQPRTPPGSYDTIHTTGSSAMVDDENGVQACVGARVWNEGTYYEWEFLGCR